MKKNIGSLLALYPTPVTVIGAMNCDKPTWTLVAHVDVYKRQFSHFSYYPTGFSQKQIPFLCW